MADGIYDPEGNTARFRIWARPGGIPGVLEHGTSAQRNSERGRSRDLSHGREYWSTSVIGEETEMGREKSDGSYVLRARESRVHGEGAWV